VKSIIVALSASIFALSAAKQPEAKVELVKDRDRIDVMVDETLFTSYLYGPELTKPVLVPVRTPSGIDVSRRHPLAQMEGGSTDHPHHVGIFFAVDQVNGVNFWRSAAPPPQIKHTQITEMVSGTGKAKLSTVMHWVDKEEQLLLEEKRTMLFLANGHHDEYAIDFAIDLTAKDRSILFEDIEEGMFAIRVADHLRESDSKTTLQPGQPLPEESILGTGRYFSSNGDETAPNIWGKRARWVALQGVRSAKVVGVAILNHPASMNYPTYWHVRSYGLFSANPLGQGDFQRQRPQKYRKNKVIPLRLQLEPGETVHFRFLVIVYEGIRTKEQIEERFRKFAE
jgi:hypothetical protein